MATEKRLIDANEAMEYAQKVFSDPVLLYAIKTVLDNAPTVDAVEVVHGRWVLAMPRRKGRNATYRCTACGKLRSSYYNDVFQWEHCPCGAKMDGEL